MPTVAYVGNFRPDHSTENDVRRAFEHLGWNVMRVQEPAFCELAASGGRPWEAFTDTLARHDLVLHTMTQGSYPHPDRVLALWETLRGRDVPTASIHLDLFYGLASRKGEKGPQRMDLPRSHPMFRVAHVFTADGAHDAEFAADGVNHHWLPPAVRFDEARTVPPSAEFLETFGRFDVAFVGSRGYHPEWPHRPQLVDRLRERYGPRFVHVGPPGTGGNPPADFDTIRGERLNMLYATVPVFVGDWCFADRLDRYWSDRFPEVWGRGGFLIAPRNDVLARICAEGLSRSGRVLDGGQPDPADAGRSWHYPDWRIGDWDELFRCVDAALADPEGRAGWRDALGSLVRAEHTYVNRVRSMLDVIGLPYEGRTVGPDETVTTRTDLTEGPTGWEVVGQRTRFEPRPLDVVDASEGPTYPLSVPDAESPADLRRQAEEYAARHAATVDHPLAFPAAAEDEATPAAAYPDVSPTLIAVLNDAANEWGALGVALVAAQLAGVETVVARLLDSRPAETALVEPDDGWPEGPLSEELAGKQDDVELALVEALGRCFSQYGVLARASGYPGADQIVGEFASRVHDLQARVLWLGARRRYPDRLT